jgi:DNA-binding GntR family transcriptional regulator
LKYVAALTKSNPDEFATKMQTEIDLVNERTNGNVTLSALINALYQKIIKETQTITVETQEEEDAKLYEPSETPALEGKHQDSVLSTDTVNTASGS